MAKSKGREAVKLYLGRMTADLETTILPGAVKAGARVIAKQAKENLGDRKARVKGGEVLISKAVRIKSSRTKAGYRAT